MPCTRTSIGLALALLVAPSTALAGVTGVAFVHGTGKQTNALVDYWTCLLYTSDAADE